MSDRQTRAEAAGTSENKPTQLLAVSSAAKFLFVVLICSLTFLACEMRRTSYYRLTLEMSSNVPSIAQLFYNTGGGFTENNSTVASVAASSSFQQFVFDLPRAKIYGLRFDPLATAGTVAVRNIAIVNRQRRVVRRIPAVDVVPFHQIASRSEHDGKITFVTQPEINDPGIEFKLAQPLDLKQAAKATIIRQVLQVTGILLAAAIGLFLLRSRFMQAGYRLGGPVRRANSVLERVARKFSVPDFIHFDSYAIWFYVLCVAGCSIAAAADFNGSSAALYQSVYGYGVHERALIGTPEEIRSDEWVYHTPAILNETLRPNRFAFHYSPLGGHSIALTGNVPIRHISTLFRPQFWAFFVLPIEYAFAVYWQFKAFFLLTGVFTFLLFLTRSTFAGITAALWYFFSPFTQWTYSWASLLPEMVGLICLVVVLLCYLTIGKNAIALCVTALAAASCMINFALCAYPPHLIPLFWMAFFVFVGWCFCARKQIFRREAAGRRILAIGGAVVLTGAVGLLVYADLREAITAVSQTVYPGHRLFSGGTLPLPDLMSHFFEWTETSRHFPPALSNICEASGFLWLAPATILLAPRLALARWQKFALCSVWCGFVLILLWLIAPLPTEFGRIFGFDKTVGVRCLPALGLANISIVALCMASTRRKSVQRQLDSRSSLRSGLALLIIFAVAFSLLFWANRAIGRYFSSSDLILSTCFVTILLLTIFERRKFAWAVTLILSQAVLFGGVNPVERGLGVITSSSLFHFVRSHPELLHGKWIVFSESPVPSGFLVATGADVYTDLRYIPDIDHFALLAKNGLDVTLFNRDGFLTAQPIGADVKSSAHLLTPGFIEWNVNPSASILRDLGIKYVAFTEQPPKSLAAGLTPLAAGPIDRIWLYALR